MAISAYKIGIVGCGPGSPAYLTPAALERIRQADVLVGSPRLLDLFAHPGQERIPFSRDIEEALERIAQLYGAHRVVVLVTGDPGLFSLARPVIQRFGRAACEVLPGISSLQTAFAKIGLDWSDARIIHAHEQVPMIDFASLVGYDRIAVLAGPASVSRWTADLAEALGPDRTIYVCENLTLPQEKIQTMAPAALRRHTTSSRAVILLIKEELPS